MSFNRRARAAVAAMLAAGLGMPMVPAAATESVTIDRFAGEDRFETAALIAEDTFPDGASSAVIAFGFNFPDALAASYLAGFVDGPILLTETNDVPDFTMDALSSLGVGTCYIVGGTHVVGSSAQAELDEVCDTTRIAGQTRYETAADIATTPPDANVGTLGAKGRTAFVATGEKFADALAAGPISAAEDFPVILTRPSSLSPEAEAALEDLGIEHVLMPGGTQAVSSTVEAEIEAKGVTVQRFAGTDRQETAVLLARFGAEELGDDLDHVNVAAGSEASGGADALALAPHGASESPTLLCENSSTCGDATLGFVEEAASTIASIHIAGGTTRISQNAENELEDAAKSSASGAPSVTRADAVNASTVRLTLSEAVQPSGGGSYDKTQFGYDADGAGTAKTAQQPTSVSGSGNVLTLTFDTGVVATQSDSDEVAYNDNNDSAAESGDVVDSNGNPMRDQTIKVSNSEDTSGPEIDKAVAVNTSEVVLKMNPKNLPVIRTLDPAQFAYAPGERDGQQLRPVKATSATVSPDGKYISLVFPAGTVQADNPLDAVSYTDDDTTGNNVVDAEGHEMKTQAEQVVKTTAPTMSSARTTSTPGQVVVTFDTAVEAYGGTVSPAQFVYDSNTVGSDGGETRASQATLSDDGLSATLTFPGGVVDRTSTTDNIVYNDSNSSPDSGDVVVKDDGMPMANGETEVVVAGDQVSGAPTVVLVQAVDTTSIRVQMSEDVKGSGDKFDLTQFQYDPDGAGTAAAKESPTHVAASGSELFLTFDGTPAVAFGSSAATFRYVDANSAAADDGDVVDLGGIPLADTDLLDVAPAESRAPKITTAKIDPTDPKKLTLTVDTDLVTTALDPSQFFYDTAPADASPGVNPTSASASGTTITLTFAANLDPLDADDVIIYRDVSGAGDDPTSKEFGIEMENQDELVKNALGQ